MAPKQGFSFGQASAVISLNTTDFEKGVKRIVDSTNIMDQQFKRTQQLMKTFSYDSDSVMNKVVKSFDSAASSAKRNADALRAEISQNEQLILRYTRMMNLRNQDRDALRQQAEGLRSVNDVLHGYVTQLDQTALSYAQNAAGARNYASALQSLTAQQAALLQSQQRSNFNLKGTAPGGAFAPPPAAQTASAQPANFGPAGIMASVLGPQGAAVAAVGVALNQWIMLLGRATKAAEDFVRPFIELHDQLIVNQAAFTGFLGNLNASQHLTRLLRDYASETGAGFENTLEAAKMIIPAMQRAGSEVQDINKYLDVMRRLAVLNSGPNGGISGAAIAIGEAISSGGTDLRSIRQRFNVSSALIKSFIQRANGDVITGLNNFLNSLGVTTEVADAATKTWEASTRRLGDALTSLGTISISPFLDNFLIPLVSTLAQVAEGFVQAAQRAEDFSKTVKYNPLNVMGAQTNTSTSVAGSPYTAEQIQQINRDRAAGLVTLLIRAPLIRFGQLMDMFNLVIAKSVSGIAKLAEMLFRAVGQTTLANNMRDLGNSADGLAKQLEDNIKQGDAAITALGLFITTTYLATDSLGEFADTTQSIADTLGKSSTFTPGSGNTSPFSDYRAFNPAGTTQTNLNPMSESLKRLGDMMDLKDNIKTLTADFTDASKKRLNDFNEDEAKRYADYLKERARDQEDYDRDRKKDADKLATDIAKADSDLADKRTVAATNAAKDIEKLQADNAADEEKKLQKHLSDMQRMREESQRRLEDAAARLDAIAFIKELENQQKQEQESQDAFEEEKRQRQADIQTRITEIKQEAADKLAIAQREHDQNVQRLRDEYAQSQALAAEQFAIKKQREAEDYALAAQQRKEAFNKEQAAANADYQQKLQALMTQLRAMTNAEAQGAQDRLAAQRSGQDQALASFKTFMGQIAQAAKGGPGTAQQSSTGGTTGSLSSPSSGTSGSSSNTSATVYAPVTTSTGFNSKYQGVWANFDYAFGGTPPASAGIWATKWFQQPFYDSGGNVINNPAQSFWSTYHYIPSLPNYDVGGAVRQRGVYNLMGGEQILPSDAARSVRSMLGPDFTHQTLVSALKNNQGGGQNLSLTFEIGQVNGIEDFENKMAKVADKVLLARLQNYGST